MNSRIVLSSIVGVVALGVTAPLAVTASTAPPAGTSPSTPPTTGVDTDGKLRVLLTNDDGWNGGGLLALRDELIAAGFDVVVFAPADDQSGNSARMTFGRPVSITQEQDAVFSVTGSPADAAEVGLSLAFPGSAPDLVISGPNPGANIANASIHSGTIGAAVTAANEGIPAIAVSTNGDPETLETDYTVTNDLVVDLVNALIGAANGGALLPAGYALNVNVPFVAAGGEPAGAVITNTDRSYLDLDYSNASIPALGESVEATGAFVITPSVDPASDAAAIENGQIAITVIQGNYDAASAEDAGSVVASLEPIVTALG